MTLMKKTALFLLMFFFVAVAMFPVLAKEGEVEDDTAKEPPGDWLKLNFTNTYASRYMWRGVDLNNGNPMWEPVMEFVLGESGNTVTVQGYYGLQGSRLNDEVDFIWKYEYKLNPHFCLAFNIAYYDIYHQITSCYGETYFTLTWVDGPLKPAISYYKELRPEGTNYYNLTLAQDVKCGDVPLSLGLSAGFSYGPLVPTIPGFTDLEINMSSDFVSKDNFSLTGKVAYNLTPSDPECPTNRIVWYSLGAKLKF